MLQCVFTEIKLDINHILIWSGDLVFCEMVSIIIEFIKLYVYLFNINMLIKYCITSLTPTLNKSRSLGI